MPVGVHVGVVDPGVGTARRPIGIRTGRGDVLIGPDNGLLTPAAERLGGIVEARALENRAWMLPRISATFHGRDIFSPMAGHIAAGGAFEDVGPSIAVSMLTRIDFPAATVGDGTLETSIVYVDSFGNLRFAGLPDDLQAAIGPLEPGRRLRVEFGPQDGSAPIVEVVPWATTFGEVPVGSPLLYEDSFGELAYADNQSNVAARLGVRADRPVRIEPA
jgi:S-adenosylmethionine hydrolase